VGQDLEAQSRELDRQLQSTEAHRELLGRLSADLIAGRSTLPEAATALAECLLARGAATLRVPPGRLAAIQSRAAWTAAVSFSSSPRSMTRCGLPRQRQTRLSAHGRRSVEAADPSHPEALPRAHAAWRCRALAGVIVATAVGLVLHGPQGEIRYDFGGEWPSAWLLLGLVALAVAAFGPGLAGACLALAAVWSWRRLGTSSRLARAAWVLWVLGPLTVLLLPVAHLFDLNVADADNLSHQVRYLLTVTAPALFALLPGTLSAALVLERFLPESRAPGQITLLAAPACTLVYLLPLGVLAQLAFHPGLYLGLLLLASSPLVPLLAVRWLLRRETPNRAARLVRAVVVVQGALGAVGVALVAWWLAVHPLLRALLGQINFVWVLGLVVKVLASKWLTTVVVTDLLVALLHQGQESARALAGTAVGEALAQKLGALGDSLRRVGPTKGPPVRAVSVWSRRGGKIDVTQPGAATPGSASRSARTPSDIPATLARHKSKVRSRRLCLHHSWQQRMFRRARVVRNPFPSPPHLPTTKRRPFFPFGPFAEVLP
jgi:hypothetical protein